VWHEDGQLRSRRGRLLAAALAASDAAYCAALYRGRLGGPRGRALRTALDVAATAASVAVRPDSGRDSGIAAALLPAVGPALEATYIRGPVSGAAALAAPSAAAVAVRRAKGQPVAPFELVTWPFTACTLGFALRVREHVARQRQVRAEERRRQAVRDGAEFMGRLHFGAQGGTNTLDLLIPAYGHLAELDSGTEESVLGEARELRHKLNGLSGPVRGPGPALLAVALRQYTAARRNADLTRTVVLADGSPAHDPDSAVGRLLLDVRETSRHGGERVFGVELPLARPTWQLELVTLGLAIESAWQLSVCSPGYSHVPLRVIAPGVAVNLASAALAEYVQRRHPVRHSADLTLLLLPSCLYGAVAGARTMRRPTFSEDGGPIYPGLHILCGALYLWGSQYPDMSRAGRAGVVGGVAAMVAASWFSSRRRPGDGRGFLVELVWAALAGVGSMRLGSAVRAMGVRVAEEQKQLTQAAAQEGLLAGWEQALEKGRLLHDDVSGRLGRLLAKADGLDERASRMLRSMAASQRRAAEKLAQAAARPPRRLSAARPQLVSPEEARS
jgi:hypothetical protein